MSREDVARSLLTVRAPDELEAQRRSWNVVRAAFAEREPVGRPRRSLRPLVALAVVAAVLAVLVSPVGGWVEERIRGEEDARPALFRLPTAGQLLVVSPRGAWIVREDGSKRFLGAYEAASFSPRGLFVVATRGRRVTALEPGGEPRWTVTRPGRVTQARWAPSGFRIAYREGETLRVVAGDGTGDRLLARRVAPVATAWRPQPPEENFLAYVDDRGRVHVVDVDTGEELSRSKPGPAVTKLLWPPGRKDPLVVRRDDVLDVAFSPGGASRATALYSRERDATNVLVSTCARGSCREARQVFAGAGRLESLAWSPNGRWLVATLPDADQLLFFRLPGVMKVEAVSDVRREFDPGAEGAGAFPRVVGWTVPE